MSLIDREDQSACLAKMLLENAGVDEPSKPRDAKAEWDKEMRRYTLGLGHMGKNIDIFEPVILTKADKISIYDNCRIDSFVKIEGGLGVVLGHFIHIASFAHLNVGGGELLMGEHSCVASHGVIVTGGARPSGQSMSAASPLYMQVLVPGKVHIGAYAAVLSGAVVLGVDLGEGAVAAAGAVITKPIPAWEIWAGNPAKKIADRERTWLKDE